MPTSQTPVYPYLTTVLPLSPDAPMSFENIFLKLALKTPSLDAGLGQVIKSHMQGIKSVTLPGLPP